VKDLILNDKVLSTFHLLEDLDLNSIEHTIDPKELIQLMPNILPWSYSICSNPHKTLEFTFIKELFSPQSIISPSTSLSFKLGLCSTHLSTSKTFKFLPHCSAFKLPSKGQVLFISHGISITPLLSILHCMSDMKY